MKIRKRKRRQIIKKTLEKREEKPEEKHKQEGGESEKQWASVQRQKRKDPKQTHEGQERKVRGPKWKDRRETCSKRDKNTLLHNTSLLFLSVFFKMNAQ